MTDRDFATVLTACWCRFCKIEGRYRSLRLDLRHGWVCAPCWKKHSEEKNHD